jgi:Arcadin 1
LDLEKDIRLAQGSANSVKVRVSRISSMTDPDTGKPGKSIELVQVKQQRQQPFMTGAFSPGDETNLIRNIMSQFQSMGFMPFGQNMSPPKVNLFLSESEYDLLGVRFEVNEVYDMVLRDGMIKFEKSREGV